MNQRAHFFEDMPAAPLGDELKPFETGADLLGDSSLLAVPLPGHCVGHWGLLVRDGDGRKTFLVGDAAWSSAAVRDDVPPPRITTALLGETASYRKTLHDLHQLGKRNTDILLAPSHCPEIASLADLPA
mgnify:CR=1 FL=1